MAKEPMFKLIFKADSGYSCEPVNDEAKRVEEEFKTEFPDVPIVKFVLLSPYSMDKIDEDSFYYELDMSHKNEVYEDIRKIG